MIINVLMKLVKTNYRGRADDDDGHEDRNEGETDFLLDAATVFTLLDSLVQLFQLCPSLKTQKQATGLDGEISYN